MGVVFYYQGIEDATVTSQTEHADFPIENITDRDKNTLWKPSGAGNTYLTIDLGSTRACSYIVLVNSNAYAQSIDGIRLYTDPDDDGTFADDVEWHFGQAGNGVAPASGDDPLWLETFTESAARRYWRLYFTGATAATQLGFIILGGTTVTTTINYDRPRTISHNFGVETWETSGGQKHSIKRHDERKAFAIKWSALSAAYKNDFTAFWTGIEGGHLPFVFKDIDAELYYVRPTMAGKLALIEDLHQLWSLKVDLEEVL